MFRPLINRFRRKHKERTLHLFIVTVLLVASTGINILQARKVSQLRNVLEILRSEEQLRVGASVPPIEARDVQRNPVTLSYEPGTLATVLYVFSPQCGWCTRNLSGIKTLANGINGRYRFAAVSLSDDGLEDYVKRIDFQFPVLAGLNIKTAQAYKFGGTPQTLVISDDGRVQKNWMGAYTGEIKTEIESYFRVSLPELPAQDAATR